MFYINITTVINRNRLQNIQFRTREMAFSTMQQQQLRHIDEITLTYEKLFNGKTSKFCKNTRLGPKYGEDGKTVIADSLLLLLLDAGVLIKENIAQIETCHDPTPYNQNNKLIELLHRKPENSVPKFLRALRESNQEHIIDILLSK